jgi:large subunit ribosomal protein L16
MFIPKKVKHRKWHKGRARNIRTATQKVDLAFGSYGLKVLDHIWITSRQLEAARRAMTRYIKRGGKIWIRVFPDKSITNHGNEAVMGSGKGAVDYYVARVRPGTIVFEMDGVTVDLAREALRLASHKLGVKTKFITK